MQIVKEIKSPFKFEAQFSELTNITPLLEQIEVVNSLANKYGYNRVEFDCAQRKISIDYIAKVEEGVGCFAGISRSYKNRDMQEALYKLGCLCNVLLSSPEIVLLNGNRIQCEPIDHIVPDSNVASLDYSRIYKQFYDNVNLFLDNADQILSEGTLFLTPVYCWNKSFFRSIPTVGIYLEFWDKCRESNIETQNLPICNILGNPQTGSHGCEAITPQGEVVKANLNTSFIDLLSIFGSINSRYRHLKGVCKTLTIDRLINQLKEK